jgi:AraC-like DNA-binding protein
MVKDVLDRLLITLAVRLHAFSVCRIQSGWRLLFDPFDAVTVHYVLAGSGSVRAGSSRWLPFAPRSIIIVPARQPHALGEAQAPAAEVHGENHCTLLDQGLVTFTAGDGSPDTLLVCGTIAATYGGALGLFDHLREPMVQDLSSTDVFQHAFDLMLREVTTPGVGTQAMTEALMKQCLILLLRQQLTLEARTSPLFAAFHDPDLARAVTEVLANPAASHTVESLAIIAGMGRSSFAERFAQAFGQTPIDFVQKVRLRLAAQLLTTTDLPVKVIASSIGYASRSYFSRAFRAAYGADPKTYRQVGGREEQEPEPIEGRATGLPPTGSVNH